MTPSLPPLTTELWVRVRDAYSSMAELAEAERDVALDELRHADPAVAQHVAAMLRASERESPLDTSIGTILDDLLSPESVEMPRQTFGPYRLVRPLGRGGMGMVYLGQRDDLGSLAAIKILPHAWVDPSRRQQFVEEMRIVAELSHESIAGLLHAGQLDDGTPWFAMQYVEGEPITEWVWRQGLPADEILRLFDRLCAAVQHAHGYPIIHRDLKPSNALVTPTGAVKLLDFGIAKRLRDIQGPDQRSRTITREVTVEYAAPEQMHGKRVGVHADVYALGIMLYELLCGSRPYEVADLAPGEAESVIRAAYPWSLGVRRADVSGKPAARFAVHRLRAEERNDLDALIGRATAPDVVDRYGSVEEMRRDIAAFLERKPLVARRAGLGYRARKLVRREWRVLSVTVVLAIAALTGVALHNRTLRESRDMAIAEAARTTRLRQYLEDLFQGGPQPQGSPDSVRVATLIENGIRDVRDGTADPGITIELLGTLGTMSQRLGALPRADTLFALAISRSTGLYGPNHPETLRARVRRAALLAQLGKRDSAENELRLVDSLARRYAPSHPVTSEADVALGSVLRDRARYKESADVLRRAVTELRARDSTSRELAVALRELGNAEGQSGNLALADSLWVEALPLVRRLYGPRHPEVAFLLTNLGNTASQRGRLEEAERYQREAVAILSAWYGTAHYLTGATTGVLVQTLIRRQRYEEAVPLARSVIEIFTRSPDLGPDAPPTRIAHSILAVALSNRGDHAEARREYDIALEGLRRAEGERGRNTINVSANRALEFLYTGHVDSAVALLRAQIPIATAAYGNTHPLTAEVRLKLGEALLAQHRFSEAIGLTSAALPILDARYGRRSATTRRGRQTLVASFAAVGDTASVTRVRAELADSLATPAAKK